MSLNFASWNQLDRTTIEQTFRELVELVNSLDEEQKRATREGLSEEELALFGILLKDDIGKADRELVKRASRELLVAVRAALKRRSSSPPMSTPTSGTKR